MSKSQGVEEENLRLSDSDEPEPSLRPGDPDRTVPAPQTPALVAKHINVIASGAILRPPLILRMNLPVALYPNQANEAKINAALQG